MTAVTIAVCTFRRPHLARTLASIGEMRKPQSVSLQVLVVDNDDTPSARDLVQASALPFPVHYLHAPAGNISIARNAALAAASTRYLAFVDDDEIVGRDWLQALWMARLNSGQDIMLGPVNAIVDQAAAAWIRNGGFHDTRPVHVNGRIVTGYCCNVLIDLQAPAIAGRRFRLDLGRSGGEDTAFFYAATSHGATIGYAPEAVIEETLPKSRQSLRWLQQRRYRSGQTHALLLLEEDKRSRPAEMSKAAIKALICGLGCMATIWSPVRWRRWYLRGILHLGTISGLLGRPSVAIYGAGPVEP